MKKGRPAITPEWQAIDTFLEAMAAAGVVAILALTIYHYGNLPEEIPIHFNLKGDPDGFGSKPAVWLMPGVSIFIYALLTVVNRFPHTFNFTVEITEANAEKQYAIATRMIRFLKAIILAGFTYIHWEIISTALGKSPGLGNLFMVVFLGAVFGTIGYFVVKSRQEK
jgi:uncharacterized membrane protein